MTSQERHQRMNAARIHANLTVQDLWLRYLGLSGTGDAFDLDGYLQGLIPLEPFQEEVLAQAVNETLLDLYNTYNIPPTQPIPEDNAANDRLHALVEQLLDPPPPG